jgi:hypothetical protein
MNTLYLVRSEMYYNHQRVLRETLFSLKAIHSTGPELQCERNVSSLCQCSITTSPFYRFKKRDSSALRETNVAKNIYERTSVIKVLFS